MKRTLLLFILAIATSGILSAATVFPFKKYRVADGLSHNTANCVIRDSYGFLWIGTGNGLNCYNGQSNRIYRNINGIERTLGNNNVRALMENDSDIWVGTGNGVYIYHRMTDDFTRFDKRTRHDVFVSSEVNRIVRGSDGLIWIATMGQGVFVYDPATDTLTQSILHSSFAWDLCNGTDSIVYVSSLKKGLLLFDRSGRFITSREVIPGSGGDIKINCLLSDNNGGAWFGVDNRLEHCPGTTGTITASELPSGAVILCLSDYGSGRILAGTTDGLYIHDTATGQWERVTSPAGTYNLSCPTINDLLVDDEGTLWVMTASGGVSYMPRQLQRFKSLTIPDTGMPPGIPCDINAFCQHIADSSVYIGTRLGLWKFDMTTHSLEEYRLGRKYNIKCLLSDGDTLWAGTSGDGLLAIDTRTGRLTRHTHSDRTPNSIPGNTVQAIGKASDGKVYVGTDLGLCSYKPATGNFEVYIVFSAMNPITAIQITANGSIWVGTQNLGLFHRQADNEHWQHYEHVSGDTSSIASNSIVSIFEDADGGIWLGTNGNGLSLYQPDSDNFTNSLTENMPLRNEIIYSITEDDLGYFWIPTDKGLFRIDRANGRHRLYTMSDGLQGDQFIAGSAMKATDGTMYFGGTSGFNMFRPDEIRENAYIPAVHITGITFPDSDNGAAGSFADSSGTPIYLRREISLPYDRNSFTIDFAALSLQDPSRNSYRYMLKGIDSKWIASDTENHARYSHLPPGKYEFMVTGSNNDGFWNDKAATITITITPPWWQSLWAYMVYLLLIGAAMGYIVYLSNRYAKRKFRQRVEAFNLAKEKETYEAKITFFMNLVHEIRTPLSLICLPLEKLRDSRSGDNTRYIGMIDKNVSYLLGVTNQLLDFQKIENGSATLDRRSHRISELFIDIEAQFSEAAALRGLSLVIGRLPDDSYVMADFDKTRTIIVNLLGNALKYARTTIEIKVSVSAESAAITVEDDGCGIPAEYADRIFDRYYRVPGHPEIKGTGIGLAFSRMLADAQGGSLTYSDRQGGGSSFTLTIPLADAAGHDNATAASQAENTDRSAEAAESELPSLLIVEDNTDLRRMMHESLSEWYAVQCASNGQEALDMLENTDIEPDLIISDVAMPIMDGIELCRRLKSDINLSHIPVILLTARTTLQAKTEGLESGAAIYIEKPFTIKQLHLQIENILAMRRQFHAMLESSDSTDDGILPSEEFQFSPKDKELIERINDILLQQIDNIDFSIDSLAAGVNMSRSNFHRKIKAVTGMTPNKYMMNFRMLHAARLLEEGMRINEVSMQLGFTTSYFAKCFKAKFGMLPKEYTRKQSRVAGE